MMQPAIQPTPYGDVNSKALSALQEQFDSTTLLRLVEFIDALRPRFEDCSLRDDVLRLHAMVHTVVNGAPVSAPTDSEAIWELAQILSDEFSDKARFFQSAATRLTPLVQLDPN